MQNHGDYNYAEDDFNTTIKVKKYESSELEQYLSLINESDKALENFIKHFEENNDEKVVVLFFGDHLPYIPDTYNCILGKNWESNLSNKEKMKMSTIPFFIWANYEIDQKDVGTIGTQYLSLLLKDVANIPFTAWDNFRKEVMEKYPAFNSFGTYNDSGDVLERAHLLNDEILKDYNILQYYFLKDEGRK